MATKYALVLNDEDFFYAGILEQLLIRNKIDIACVYVVDALIPKNKKISFLLKSALIAGLRFSAYYIWKSFLRRRNNQNIQGLCRHFGVTYSKVANVNDIRFLANLRHLGIERILSLCSQIYREEILNSVQIYNFHPSLLPKHKGRLPVFWALHDHDEVIGLSCHKVTNKIDDGPVLYQVVAPIRSNDNFRLLIKRIFVLFPEIIEKSVEKIEKNEACFVNEIQGSYDPIPTYREIIRYRLKKLVQIWQANLWRKDAVSSTELRHTNGQIVN